MIKVETQKEDEFRVIIKEKGTQSEHQVFLDSEYYESLTGKRITKEELIKRSFEFLLQREPKESILSRFNLKVIGDYFPEYEEEIKKYCKHERSG